MISVITITGIGDQLRPEWLITFTGMRNLLAQLPPGGEQRPDDLLKFRRAIQQSLDFSIKSEPPTGPWKQAKGLRTPRIMLKQRGLLCPGCGFRRCRLVIPRSCRSLFRHDVGRLRASSASGLVLARSGLAVNPLRLASVGSGAGCRR